MSEQRRPPGFYNGDQVPAYGNEKKAEQAIDELRQKIADAEDRVRMIATKDAEIARLKADLAAERDMVQRLASELHDEYAKRHQRERAPATWEQSHDFADWSMKEIGLREIDGKWERVK